IAGEIEVKVTVLKDCKYPTPFLVNDERMMAIYSALTLDEAASGATLRMREFLINEIGMEEHEAGFLLSAIGDIEICQCVDPNRTCRMEVSLDVAKQYSYSWR
nr:acetamidase [Lachnospiraceae bacterium]